MSEQEKMRGRVNEIEYWPDGAAMFAKWWLNDTQFVVAFEGMRPPMSLKGCRIEVVGESRTDGDLLVIIATSCMVVDDEGNATPVECEPCQEGR